MADVKVTLQPPVAFIVRQSGRFRHELQNLEPLWNRFKPIMAAIEEEQFSSHGHGAWPAWSPNTRVHGSDLLVLTGALKGSLTSESAAQTSAMEMVWSTDVPYAHWHQDGGAIPGRPPVRKVIDLRGEDIVKFQMAMVQWINEVAARTWGAI